jgi:hypothetical protein
VSNLAVKAVNGSFLSCGVEYGSGGEYALAFNADQWASLQLDYTPGNDVEPSTGNAPIYAWIDDPDLPASGDALFVARAVAGAQERLHDTFSAGPPFTIISSSQTVPPGRVVSISYEDADLVRVDPPRQKYPRVSVVRLLRCHVVEEIT